jgi:hypothetical protein
MVRTSITPEQTDIHISVPQNYVGRKLEVLLYPIDELINEPDEKPIKRKPSDFAGTLSKEEGAKFHKYLKEIRNEWDRVFDRHQCLDRFSSKNNSI